MTTSEAAATPQDQPRYIGLVTRGVAFALDAVVIDLVALIVGFASALILSLLHLPKEVKAVLAVIGAASYFLWTLAYFVGFWSATGQTPGNRVMQIRVLSASGERLKTRRAVVRFVGLILAALPLFAGYVVILFNRRRRGFQDYLARSVVVDAPQLSVAEMHRPKSHASAAGAR
jgi:uncharacterized RDD family membrane protein YckC